MVNRLAISVRSVNFMYARLFGSRTQMYRVAHIKRRHFTFLPWSSNVIDFGTNPKRVYIFLLVINSNLDRNLHRFRDTAWLKCPKSTFSLPHSYSG